MAVKDLLEGFDWDTDKPIEEPEEVEVTTEEEEPKEEPIQEEPAKPKKEEPQDEPSVPDVKSIITKVFDIDIEEEIDPDTAIEYTKSLIDDKIEEGVQEIITEWKEAIGETGAEFIKWTMQGGTVEDYLKSFNPLLVTSDISTESGQRDFLKKVLLKDGQDEDDAEETLDMWEGSGKLEVKAANAMKKLRDEDEKQRRKILEEAEEARKKAAKAATEAQKKLKEGLVKVNTVLGNTIPKVEKELLIRDITFPSQGGEPKFISDLKKALTDPENLMFLARIVRTGFDADKITALFEGKAIQKIEKKLDEKPPKTKTSEIPSSNSPIWDLLDD